MLSLASARKVIAAFAVGLMVTLGATAAAEDILFSGTISPLQVLSLSYTPSTVDLTSNAGDIVTKTVTFQNTGNVTARISLASSTDVAFTGPLNFVDVANNVFDRSNPSQANYGVLRFIWDPAGWPANMADFYFMNTDTIRAYRNGSPFSAELFTLAPGETRDTQVRLETSQYLPSQINISGRITLTISAT